MDQGKVEILNELGVDLSVTLDRFLGKEDFYLRMLGKFADDPSFLQLKETMEAGDFPEAFKAAHTMKGVAANLGLERLNDKAVSLTEALRNPPYDEAEIMGLYQETVERYELTLEGIGKLV